MSEAAAPADGAQTPADAPAADTAPEAPAAPDTAAQDAPDGGEVVEDQDQDHDHDHDGDGREAAKYRKKLRDAATQRDQAVEQITTMQKSEAERIAANRLADGADLWRDGLTVGELLDDAGNLDPQRFPRPPRQSHSSTRTGGAQPNRGRWAAGPACSRPVPAAPTITAPRRGRRCCARQCTARSKKFC